MKASAVQAGVARAQNATSPYLGEHRAGVDVNSLAAATDGTAPTLAGFNYTGTDAQRMARDPAFSPGGSPLGNISILFTQTTGNAPAAAWYLEFAVYFWNEARAKWVRDAQTYTFSGAANELVRGAFKWPSDGLPFHVAVRASSGFTTNDAITMDWTGAA